MAFIFDIKRLSNNTLVRGKALHDLGHLLIRVYPKALVLGNARQLHVLRVELLLHDLLQRLENQRLGVNEREGLEGRSQ